MDRMSGPRRSMMIYSIEQEVPLWGKRDLKKAIALAEVERATAQSQSAELELAERVKVAFAAYYQAEHAVKAGETLHRAIHAIAKVSRDRRSEEHTSELQSLMRISYAVFCLKKK